MAAIVRVKRRINDDPADSLVFSSKRPRRGSATEASGNNDTEEVKNLFKFAGTVQSEDDCVSRAVREAIKKEKLEKEFKLHSVDAGSIMSRSRVRSKAGRQLGRYKVIAQRRAMQLEDLDKEDKENDPALNKDNDEKLPYRKQDENKENKKNEAIEQQNKVFLLWDIEHEAKSPAQPPVQKPIQRPICKPSAESTITCNDVALERESVSGGGHIGSDDQYVYDLYYMNRRDIDLGTLDNILNIEACTNDPVFDQYREPEELEVYDDEDDSNDEGNWRNDYPDEDPKFYDNKDADYGFEPQCYGGGFGGDDDEELGTIIDRGLHLGVGGFGQDLSSDEDEKEPVYDFNQPLDSGLSGIWGAPSYAPADTSTAPSAIWGGGSDGGAPTCGGAGIMGSSDAMADDWVSKSLDANFDLDSGGISGGLPGGSSMWSSSMMAPWMSTSTASDDLESERTSSRLWAPSTDFDQYKTRILREMGDGDSRATVDYKTSSDLT